jgi:serine/threonine protein kinase
MDTPRDPPASPDEDVNGGGSADPEIVDSAAGSSSRGNDADEQLEKLLKQELAPDLEVLRCLGRGSMATVYLAREESLKRLVAVKVLSPKLARDERARQRFEREAQAVAAISHPNIVAIYRVGRLSNDLPYFVMQYVKGTTLAERLRAKVSLAGDEARRIVSEVASALAAAHDKGIVHRDVRAGNVLYEEGSGRALLADFGIAAVLVSGESGAPTRLTRTGELIGDPSYMSPEQLRGEDVTERSDLYALGLMGYETAAGRGPYEVKSKRDAVTAHIKQEPRKLSELRAGVEPLLEDVLLRCLAKEPGHRPSAADVAEQLKAPTGEIPVEPQPGPLTGPDLLRKIAERRIPQIALIYGFFALGIFGVAANLADRGIISEVVFRLVLVAEVTGLPAVLVGAWFHGRRGRQKFEPVEYWVFGALGLVWLVVSVVILLTWTG